MGSLSLSLSLSRFLSLSRARARSLSLARSLALPLNAERLTLDAAALHCDGQTTSGEIDRDEQIKGENRAGLSHQPVHQRQNGLREREPEYEPTGLTDPQLLERFG